MAKLIEGVYQKVIECAQEEFLENGFKDASLRVIAQKANTSTSSIYTRFKDKEGLFSSIVEPIVEELNKWFDCEQEQFDEYEKKDKEKEVFVYSKTRIKFLIDYIFDNKKIFKLLLTCSDGTNFSDFIHNLVEKDVKYTVKYINSTSNDALISKRITLDVIHMLSSSYYTGVFESVIHDMTREDAHIYVMQLTLFFQAGWKEILRYK